MRAWCAAAAVCASVLGSHTTFAQPSGRDAVDVVIAADEGSGIAMRAVVAELIARLGIAATVTFATAVNPVELITPQAGAQPRVARVWIDLSKPERATLYLVDNDWERILIRHVRKLPGHEELAREALGHIVETAVDALAHGAKIGIAREEARAQIEHESTLGTTSAPPTPAPSGPTVRVEFGALYEAELDAQNRVVTSGPGGIFYAGSARGAVRPGAWMTLQYRLPVVVDAVPFGVRLEGGSGRVLASVDLAVDTRLAVRVGAGAGFDVLHMTPRPEGLPGTMRGNDEDFAFVVARVSCAVLWSPSPHLALALTASLDLDPSGTRYVAFIDGVSTTVLSPAPLRPTLSAGVAIPYLL